MNDIARNIRKIARSGSPLLCGTVQNVDKNNMLCEVGLDDGGSIMASLVVGDKNKGIIQIPKIGSYVAVIMDSRASGFVVMSEEVEQIIINGGENGGLINIKELVEKLNNVINTFNNHTHPATSGTTSPTASQLTTIQQDDMEDKKITH